MTDRPRKPYNPDDIVLARLDETDFSNVANFNCWDDEVNHFLWEEAYLEQGLGLNYTTLLYYQGRLAAFCSVCCDAIPFNPDEKEQYDLPYASAPAIKLARLGRAIEYKDYGFGEYLVDFVKNYQHLEKIFTGELGTREDYKKEFGDTPFGLLVRKMAKLDREAANQVFSKFINDESLTRHQIVFVNKIIDYIVENGYIDSPARLMETPFDKPQKITQLFDKETVTKIIQAVNGVKDNAIKVI